MTRYPVFPARKHVSAVLDLSLTEELLCECEQLN